MNWIILTVSGLFETAFAFCLGKAKENTGNEMVWWYAGFGAALLISMTLLLKAIQTLPAGTAYAVWAESGRQERFLSEFLSLRSRLRFGGCVLFLH